MRFFWYLCAVTAIFRSTGAQILVERSGASFDGLGLSERADYKGAGVKRNDDDFGSEPIFQGEEPAAFLEALIQEKNETNPFLQDRSMELYKRQNCETGYGYCASLGGCCPSNNRCCSYGYCLVPGATCCPNGPCPSGSTCCGNNNCHPTGTQCCSNGRYCEVGNICVIFRGESGCCTDLKCTAVVRSGTTSFATTATPPPPVVTQPPRTTEIVVENYRTYYWTVRWWYYSYYWYVFQARSTVTYTTIYVTTTFTTTATDAGEASRVFGELSKSLTFSTPAEATTLASLLGAAPSPTATPTRVLETELGTPRVVSAPSSVDDDALLSSLSALLSSVTRESTSRTTSSRAASSSSAPATVSGGGSAAGSVAVQMTFVLLAVLSGILMVWL